MVSLFERQKLERRRAVLNAAKVLIKKNGYEETTMEGLASHAGLSTQTVYNYFGTKLDLLMELYVEDRDIAFAKIDEIIAAAGDRDPVELLLAILNADMHREVDAVSCALWRHVAAAEVTSCEGKHFETFRRMNDRHRGAIVRLMKDLAARGIFDPALNTQAAAQLFLHLNEGVYRQVIATADAPFSTFHRQLRPQLELLVAAFRGGPGAGVGPKRARKRA